MWFHAIFATTPTTELSLMLIVESLNCSCNFYSVTLRANMAYTWQYLGVVLRQLNACTRVLISFLISLSVEKKMSQVVVNGGWCGPHVVAFTQIKSLFVVFHGCIRVVCLEAILRLHVQCPYKLLYKGCRGREIKNNKKKAFYKGQYVLGLREWS